MARGRASRRICSPSCRWAQCKPSSARRSRSTRRPRGRLRFLQRTSRAFWITASMRRRRAPQSKSSKNGWRYSPTSEPVLTDSSVQAMHRLRISRSSGASEWRCKIATRPTRLRASGNSQSRSVVWPRDSSKPANASVDTGSSGNVLFGGAPRDIFCRPGNTCSAHVSMHDRNLHQGFGADDGAAERNNDHC